MKMNLVGVAAIIGLSAMAIPASASADILAATSSTTTTLAKMTVVVGNTIVMKPSCPLISSFMKVGWKNDETDVTRLQNFLKNSEKLDVAVTGTYDAQTEQAVEAFQRKYIDSVMAPWGATRPSGVVLITTVKKVNQLACNIPLTLNTDELGQIKDYGSQASTTAPTATVTVSPVQSQPIVESASDTSPSEAIVGPTLDIQQAPLSENSSSASVSGRFWAFIKKVF